jgi:hypothetical protein
VFLVEDLFIIATRLGMLGGEYVLAPYPLEDLILNSCNENIRNIIENFIDQIEEEGLVIHKKSKYRVHCYFGAKCSHKLYIKLSNAIQNCDFIDFSHKEILAPRERVLNFFQEETDV